MEIRRAKPEDSESIKKLLSQVLEVHYMGRPDLFRADSRKYTDSELEELMTEDDRPIFVAVIGTEVVGYAFCIMREQRNSNIMNDVKTLYIDDLCVAEGLRGQKIGSALFEYVREYAVKNGCYNLTLNVWACNSAAMRFYEKCGLKPQKTEMEEIL